MFYSHIWDRGWRLVSFWSDMQITGDELIVVTNSDCVKKLFSLTTSRSLYPRTYTYLYKSLLYRITMINGSSYNKASSFQKQPEVTFLFIKKVMRKEKLENIARVELQHYKWKSLHLVKSYNPYTLMFIYILYTWVPPELLVSQSSIQKQELVNTG